MRPKRKVPIHSLEIDYGGTTHHGTYVVERGILTVRSGFGSRSTELDTAGTINPAGLAKHILRALVAEHTR